MNKIKKLLVVSVLSMVGQQAQAITIDFDYTYDSNGFFNTQVRKDALTNAGNYFANRINDSLSAINSSGGNHFNAAFSNPGTGATITINDFNVAADTLRVYAGGRNLIGSTIGLGGAGGFGVSGTSSFKNDAISRGQGSGASTVTLNPRDSSGNVITATATDFAPWGGAISFDTTASTTWYFDDDTSTVESFSGNDFYSVAIHELGHLLGFGGSDSWDNQIVLTNKGATNESGKFSGTASSLINGEDIPLLRKGDGTTENPFHYDHWKNGTTSLVNGVTQDTSMDPSIQTGTRKYFTDLDVAALSDIGWEVSAVPVPAAVYFFGSALLGLGAFRKKA